MALTALQFTPVPAAVGGMVLGIAALGRLAITGRILGISGIVRCAYAVMTYIRTAC